ncbi:MAG: CXXX repeat peptide modification system protein [Bacillota bacterium]|nr:CXXX repeat peptide modification system protein [Bacillota bacterium]
MRVVWKLTEEEYIEIESLFERKIALENLAKIVDSENTALYEKMIADYGRTLRQFNEWWKIMSQKYSWSGKNWWLDFETKEIKTNEE